MKKKSLPIAGKPVPAQAQRDLSVAPVAAGSKPEFPTRGELYRKAGLLGGATLLASGLANAQLPPKDHKAPPPQVAETTAEGGTINGKALPKQQPKIRVFRDGGGIGPSEDMWQVEEVEAFLSWTMAKEGKLAIQTAYKLDYDGVSITLDGFDPNKNIGFAYVDPQDPQIRQFTKTVRDKLDAWLKAKKLAILMIEIKRYPDTAALKGKVIKFLHAVSKAPPAAGKITAGPATPTPAPAKKK